MPLARVTCPLLQVGALRGCLAMWSISHDRGYRSGESTVRSPHPCSLSCGAPLLARPPPSSAVCWHACQRLLPSLWVTLALVPDADRRG